MNSRKYAGIILKYSGSFAHSLSSCCVWGLRLVVFSSVCDRMDRGSDRESGGALLKSGWKIVRRHGSMVLIAGVLATAVIFASICAVFLGCSREMTEFGQAPPGILCVDPRRSIWPASGSGTQFEVSSCRHGDDDRVLS